MDHKRRSNLELSGNEVYNTISSLLPIKIMLCSKLHGQEKIDRDSFPIKSHHHWMFTSLRTQN